MNCESPLLTLILQFNSDIPPGTSDRYSVVRHPAIARLFFDAELSGPTLVLKEYRTIDLQEVEKNAHDGAEQISSVKEVDFLT